jgi:hypothetical protein
MTDIRVDDKDLIDRYLANRLTDAEVSMVETRIVEDTRFRNEVELTEALRDGLQELQRRGEITPLLSPRPDVWRRSRFALAAALAAVTVGTASFLLYQRMGADTGAYAVASLHFELTRGGDGRPDVEWQQTGEPTRLEMSFDVGPEPAAAYRVAIERVAGELRLPALAAEAATSADGEALLTVDAAALEPGDYRITVAPRPPAASLEPVVYALRIAGER